MARKHGLGGEERWETEVGVQGGRQSALGDSLAAAREQRECNKVHGRAANSHEERAGSGLVAAIAALATRVHALLLVVVTAARGRPATGVQGNEGNPPSSGMRRVESTHLLADGSSFLVAAVFTSTKRHNSAALPTTRSPEYSPAQRAVKRGVSERCACARLMPRRRISQRCAPRRASA